MLSQIIVSGALTGLLYALIAFGFQLTYATSKTANFGQGALVMFGGLLAASLTPLIGYWAAMPCIALICALLGIVVERCCIAPALKQHDSSSAWIVATIALGIVFTGAQELLFGKDELAVATPFSETPLALFNSVFIMPHELFIGGITLLTAASLEYFYRSRHGKIFEAVSCDSYAAQLQGISTHRIILGSYIVSSIFAGLAGWIISPITGAGLALDLLGIKGFCAAVVGSLSSSRGALLAGILIGILENLAAFFLPSGYRALPALLLCVLVISLRPTGLFGTATLKKV